MLFFLIILLPLMSLASVNRQKSTFANDFCLEPFDAGTCGRIEGWDGFERFYFNATTKKCEKFTYSGCGGNANRFFEEGVCERVCGFYFNNPINSPDVNMGPENPITILSQINITEMAKRLCHRGLPFLMPTSPGDSIQCNGKKLCPDGYDCIFGPKNYRPSLAICCPERLIVDYRTSTSSSTPATTIINIITEEPDDDTSNNVPMRPEWCLLAPVVGPCRQVSQAWYFDISSGTCQNFTYGGCKGNQNRFRTRLDCEKTCPPLVVLLGFSSTQPAPTRQNNINRTGTVTMPVVVRNIPRRCTLPVDSGSGLNYTIGYYFEPALSTCLPFMYGNCGGNENRFENELSCVVVCRPEMAEDARAEASRKDIPLILSTPEGINAFPLCGLPETIDRTTPSSPAGDTSNNNRQNVTYFKHPLNGYSPCSEPIGCLVDPCRTALCPAYNDAICKPNGCSGCLAEFSVNNQRVNCSLGNKNEPVKPGKCPISSSSSPCPAQSALTTADGKFRPQNNLCTTDAECFADQKCCADPCYSQITPSPLFKTCQTPITTSATKPPVVTSVFIMTTESSEEEDEDSTTVFTTQQQPVDVTLEPELNNETDSNSQQEVNYFSHPIKGYSDCTAPTGCLANPCFAASCPAYSDALCRRSNCSGCLAEFILNDKRVNCSSADVDPVKPGDCPRSSSSSPCPAQSALIGPDGRLRPQNNLCSTDAECFADQKCCIDPCYRQQEPSSLFKTCQTPIRR